VSGLLVLGSGVKQIDLHDSLKRNAKIDIMS
jgi:hypothetical protein